MPIFFEQSQSLGIIRIIGQILETMGYSRDECPQLHCAGGHGVHVAMPPRAKRRYYHTRRPLKGLTAVAMHHMHRQLKLLPAECTMCHIVITKAEFATLSPSSEVVSYGESTMVAEDYSVEQAVEKHPNHKVPLTQYLHRFSTEPVVLVLLTIRLGLVSHCSVIGVPATCRLGKPRDDREDSGSERKGEPHDERRPCWGDRGPNTES